LCSGPSHSRRGTERRVPGIVGRLARWKVAVSLLFWNRLLLGFGGFFRRLGGWRCLRFGAGGRRLGLGSFFLWGRRELWLLFLRRLRRRLNWRLANGRPGPPGGRNVAERWGAIGGAGPAAPAMRLGGDRSYRYQRHHRGGDSKLTQTQKDQRHGCPP